MLPQELRMADPQWKAKLQLHVAQHFGLIAPATKGWQFAKGVMHTDASISQKPIPGERIPAGKRGFGKPCLADASKPFESQQPPNAL